MPRTMMYAERESEAIGEEDLDIAKANYTIDYLERFIHAEHSHIEELVLNGIYPDLSKRLANLRSIVGHDAHFFDRYFHPMAQYWTAYNFGRAGMPIVTVDTLMNGHVLYSMESMTEFAEIFYTIDGSEPSDMSSKYDGPFVVAADQTIKAISHRDDILPSKMYVSKLTDAQIQSNHYKIENKILGVHVDAQNGNLSVKFMTASSGQINVSIIDKDRNKRVVKTIATDGPQVDQFIIVDAELPQGPFLIKFDYADGAKRYRQVER